MGLRCRQKLSWHLILIKKFNIEWRVEVLVVRLSRLLAEVEYDRDVHHFLDIFLVFHVLFSVMFEE